MDKIKEQLQAAALELIERAGLKEGSVLVVGCSTSEVLGSRIGTASAPETGREIAGALLELLEPRGIFLAAQCCEHLNRALILERAALSAAGCRDIVNVVPQPKAGGSFATAVYGALKDPVAVEEIRADAGLDIGGTLIGMHLKPVAVPVRLTQNRIGEAILLAARTRPKFIGGVRAVYDQELL